jgi:hypothetical protein
MGFFVVNINSQKVHCVKTGQFKDIVPKMTVYFKQLNNGDLVGESNRIQKGSTLPWVTKDFMILSRKLLSETVLESGIGGHTCNPRYSRGSDQEDHGSKPAWANSSERLYLENPFTKIGLVEWLEVKALSSSPSTEKKKRNDAGVARDICR